MNQQSHDGESLHKIQKQFGIDDSLQFVIGEERLTKAILSSPQGGVSQIYLKGAHLTSWIPKGGKEVFYLSEQSKYQESSIRGGNPIIFPQFGGREIQAGTYPEMLPHGFARNVLWEVLGSDKSDTEVELTLGLKDDLSTQSVWPKNHFQAELKVTLGETLKMTLYVTNTGTDELQFTGGFHPYYSVSHLSDIKLKGLEGTKYEDALQEFALKKGTTSPISFLSPVNRVYLGVGNKFAITDKEKTIQIEQEGFPEIVLWTAAKEYGESKQDMNDEDYKYFVCLEPAAAATPIKLSPKQSWKATQKISVTMQ